jgi:non-heme chloroperoxidase
MHGDDDQLVPRQTSALLSANLIAGATLKSDSGYPLGMLPIPADDLNRFFFDFIRP